MVKWISTPVGAGILIFILLVSCRNELEITASRENKTTVWKQINSPNSQIYSLTISNSNILFVASETGVFRSADEGLTWTGDNDGLPRLRINSIVVNSSDQLFAGTNGRGVYGKSIGSDNWASMGLSDKEISCLVFDREGVIYAGTHDGNIYRSYDGGTDWIHLIKLIHGSFPASISALTFDSNGRIFAATNYGLYLSRDSGITWQAKVRADDMVMPSINCLFVDFRDRIYAGGFGGAYYFEAADTNWHKIPSQGSAFLFKNVWQSKSGYIYFGTDSGVYLMRENENKLVQFSQGLPYNYGSGKYSFINAIIINAENEIFISTANRMMFKGIKSD